MEFLIDDRQGISMPQVLLISSQQRAKEIKDAAFLIIDKILKDDDAMLCMYYKELAEQCVNIQEYTYGMHLLIFNLSRFGTAETVKAQ